MRDKGILFATLGAVAAVALLLGSDLPAAGAGIAFPPPGGSAQTARAGTNAKDFEAALVGLAGGAQTLGGPGTFSDDADQGNLVYEVVTGAAPDVCITVRNVSPGTVSVSVSGASTVNVSVGRTRTSCYAAPTRISLRCEDRACAAVWRVDHQ